ncbi:MAG: DNA-binding protein [Nitrososphaerales archaeon]
MSTAEAPSSEDKDLELIRARKMMELRKKLLKQSEAEKKPEPRSILVSRLVDRGLDVLKTAERAYPEETKLVVKKLAELIEQGYIKGYITGGELLSLFRALGMPISVETTISVVEDGRLVPLADKLRRKD